MTDPADTELTPTPLAAELGDAALELADGWVAQPAGAPAESSTDGERARPDRLAGALTDAQAREFTVAFVDGVLRPDDLVVAGKNLSELAKHSPQLLPPRLRAALSAGGALGEVVPAVVVPVARRVVRDLVGHLVLDSRPAKLGPALQKLREGYGDAPVRFSVTPLGETVQGAGAAAARVDAVRALVQHPGVDRVSFAVRDVVAPAPLWGFDALVEHTVEVLDPVFRQAARKGIVTEEGSTARTFLTLAVRGRGDLALSVAVFRRLLDDADLLDVEAGIELPAHLPEAASVLEQLRSWASERLDAGGARVTVAIVLGAGGETATAEAAAAASQGWPPPSFDSPGEVDRAGRRLIDAALPLSPGHPRGLRVVVSGGTLFDLAWAWSLANGRGVADDLDLQLQPAAPVEHAQSVARTAGVVLVPVFTADPDDIGLVVPPLVAELAVRAADGDGARARSVASDAARESETDAPRADVPVQDRSTPELEPAAEVFANSADTDPSSAPNREWAARILSRVAQSELGAGNPLDTRIPDQSALDALVGAAAAAGVAWGARPAIERAGFVRRAGYALEANRDRLIEVLAAEIGLPLGEADRDVSEAVDFASYSALAGAELDRIDGAVFEPAAVTAVAVPAGSPVSDAAGALLAALAAGSAVIVWVPPAVRRSSAVLAEALWESGIPRDVLSFAEFDDEELGLRLVDDDRVDRVEYIGARETAELFRNRRPELRLSADLGRGSSVIVTPSADVDQAVAEVVAGAFSGAGSDRSAGTLVILVGSMGRSKRFRRLLADAVASLRAGGPDDPRTQVGLLPEPARGEVLSALTELGPGEHWLVQPRSLDETGRSWSPGVKDGVLPGTPSHLVRIAAPVIGLAHATTLEKAIELQNAVVDGASAAIHSLDEDEVAQWLGSIEAVTLMVNRRTTETRVGRQPVGGSRGSTVGPRALVGGPDQLLLAGEWRTDEGVSTDGLNLAGLDPRVVALLEASTAGLEWNDFDLARRGAKSDQSAWESHFSGARTEGPTETSVRRYRPAPVMVRLAEGRPLHELVRVLAAATLARSAVSVSSAHKLPRPLRLHLKERGIRVVIENDAAWLDRAPEALDDVTRVRQIGGGTSPLASALHGSTAVAIYPGEAVRSGRVELLPFLTEQSITLADPRPTTPTPLAAKLVP